MIRISGNTVIPMVTWANTPPHHQITSILVSEDAEYVATGSADGNIIIWDLGNSCICTPRWMLTGHKSLVSNLCNAGRSPMSNNQFFFSYSINGEMAVWNWSDGKCLEFKMDTRYRHTYIKSHKTCFLDYRLLFCCGQYPHIVVLHATSLTVLFTLASNSQPDWISSFVVVTNPNQRSEIVLGLSFSNVATLWTLDGEEIQGEAKYEHESRSINCPSTVLQVVCCPQTPRCILLVCSTGWQLFNAMTCSIICTISNPTNDTLVGGGFITSNVISVFGLSGFAYLYCLPKSLIVQSGESVCSYIPVHIATLSPYHANNINNNNNNNNRSSNGGETVDRNPTNTVQNFSCFTPAFIHPSDDHQYMIAGTVHGQLLAWCIKLDAYLSNIDHQIGLNDVSSRRSISTIPPLMSSDLHSVWKRYTPPDIATFLTSSIADPKYHANLMNNPTLSSSSPASLLPPDSSTQSTQSTALPDTSEEKISVTVCIQLTQIICHHRLPDRRPTIHPYRLAFGLSNGRIIIVRMVDFLKTLYWEKSHTTDENTKPPCEESPLLLLNQHNRLLSKFCLTGHIGPVTSLLHPASYERQFYANSGSINENTMPTTTSNDVGNSATTATSTTNNVNSSSMNSTTNYHFNPDHLLSGGVDCTVRLWDLNPWHESMNSRKFSSSNNSYNATTNTNASRSNKSLCLAVYRCHASPCIGLTIAPPVTSVINMVAGNPRLSACICSFSLDGSVWLINLKEQRPILYARNTSSVALCPVVAIGWRVAEDLLFIAYLDGSVTIWDITMGCLERTETDQSARDLFEQAQFITEVYHPSRYLAFSFSTLPSITISTYKSRSLACLPSHNSIYTSLAVPFCGGVNSAYSSGCVAFTAPSRLKYSSIDNIHKLCMNCLPPIQLHLIGSTNNGSGDGEDDDCATSEKRLMSSGPAAFVFHWDIESLIVEILSQNNAVLKDNDESVNHNSAPSLSSSSALYHDDIFTIDVTQANFIQLILSLIHPWGIDSSVDKIVEKLCNNQFIKMMPELNSSSIHHYQSPLLHIQESLCIGLISKCGCMSLSMPGCIASKSQHLKSKSISSIPNAYCLSSIISTNLLLCGVTLTELMTSLNYKYLQRLSHTICLTTTSPSLSGSSTLPTSTSLLPSFLSSSSSSLPNGRNLPKTLHNDWRKNWLQFCAFLLDRFINLILSNRSVINNTESTSHGENALPSIDLNLFIRKWQDRCLPIRYAARTLLLTCLDRLSSEDRKLLVAYWSALLPPFSLTSTKDYPQQQQQPLPSRQMIHQQVSLDRTNINSNSNNTVGYITDILANHTELKSTTTRKQSLPQMNGLINTESNHFPAAPNGDMKKQINSSNNGIVDELNQLPVDNSTLLSVGRQSSVNKSSASAPIQLDTLPTMTESVSMTSLNSNLNLSLVLDSSWWMTLNGYRVSPRENARLQAMAIVLMGVIGMRFGSSGNSTRNSDNSSTNNDDNNNRQYHPAVIARDLITSPLIPNHQDKTSEMMVDNLNYGLTLPRFTSSSSLSASSSLNASCLSLENFISESSTTTATTHQQSYEIQDGFGLDNYYLARSTCQCLTALLFNGGYPTLLPTDGSYPEVNWRKLNEQIVGSHVEPLPVYAANALITLLTSNVNSTLRRAAIDLLGRGFPVWEPYVDVGQVINALLLLAADAELLMSSDASRLLLSDRVDLARTAREALWAIAFARPKVITLALSLEVRRYGAQIYAAASASSSSSSTNRVSVTSQSNLTNQMWNRSNSLSRDLDHLANNNTSRRDSVTAGNELHSSSLSSSNMVVMMSSPTVATPVFSPNNAGNRTATGHAGGDTSAMHNSNCPPMFKAREEVLRLFEQLCIRRPSDIKDVLPEVVEVILACSDRTRLKERGLDYVFPALTPFHSYSSHTRLQKVCTGGVNGSLTFYDFKIGRYFVTMAHKGPVTAVCFHSDGRQVATYSLTESTLRIWQLHTTGFFGMGGQQVKALSLHPVPPLVPPPPPTPKLSTASSHKESVDNQQQQQQQHQNSPTVDRLQVWIDWPESRVLHLITNTGIKRRVAL